MNTQQELAITSMFEKYKMLSENNEERYEFINDEIIKMYSPSKKHQDIVLNLAIEMKKYFKNSKCTTMISPFDIFLEKEGIKVKNVVIPDISVMCDKNGFTEKRYHGVPTIIVEVLSSNWADDTIKKLNLYSKYGVNEYWIINPNNNTFIVYTYDIERKGYYSNTSDNYIELHSKLFSDLIINMEDVFNEG